MKAALTDLKSVALSDRIPILDQQLALLEAATTSLMLDERDASKALREDREGIGAAAGLERT